MEIKKVASNSIGGIGVLLVVLVIGFLTGNEEMIDRLIETVLRETLVVPVENAADDTKTTLMIANDGDTLRNTSVMQLMGGLDFTGKQGDTITFQKHGNVWVETARTLVGERMF